MLPCTREGQFRAHIRRYLLTEAKSGAVGIRINCELFAEPGEQGWLDLEEALEADGTIWVIKKDGQVNDNAFKGLMDYTGWDGNLQTIASQGWVPKKCSVTIKREEYEGNVSFRVSFVNDYEARPTMSEARAAELQLKYGMKLQRAGGSAMPIQPSPGMDEKDIPF